MDCMILVWLHEGLHLVERTWSSLQKMHVLRNSVTTFEAFVINCSGFQASTPRFIYFFPRTMANEAQEAGGIHFPFPFTPYSIQKDFMAALYQVLEDGKIGIFESPTGTVSMNDWSLRRVLRDPDYDSIGSAQHACSHMQRFSWFVVGQSDYLSFLSE